MVLFKLQQKGSVVNFWCYKIVSLTLPLLFLSVFKYKNLTSKHNLKKRSVRNYRRTDVANTDTAISAVFTVSAGVNAQKSVASRIDGGASGGGGDGQRAKSHRPLRHPRGLLQPPGLVDVATALHLHCYQFRLP
ncbi:hypothetical protein GWI33_005750 [Rhynchophorus ferrugineus]|uniref:Uncharacterized protein n=1 Tax=Rhynchophorus ferrugineus TaxID=354439 RepID=A0A834IFY2_RHYFE|nr:hypothetical protein GWI33_005750 [Rhynchophorus ferrugineus]